MGTDRTRFTNTDGSDIMATVPWHETLWRSIRGDFRPIAPPRGGYHAFAREWTAAVDFQRIRQRHGTPVITWLGHVTILLQVGGLNILIDPTLASHAGPYGRFGARRPVPPPLAPADLPPIDALLITHNHYDHLCGWTIERLSAAGQRPHIFVPQGLGNWFRKRGAERVTELRWWDQAPVQNADHDASEYGELQLHFTPSRHWSRRTPFDTNAALWGGYVLEWRSGQQAPWRFMFPGDTGYSADFKEIRQRLGTIDLLALPIGAYLPRDFMKHMHVNPSDAVQMLLDLEAKQALAVHWGTFMLTREPLDQPVRDLAAALRERDVAADAVWLMRQGETRGLLDAGCR